MILLRRGFKQTDQRNLVYVITLPVWMQLQRILQCRWERGHERAERMLVLPIQHRLSSLRTGILPEVWWHERPHFRAPRVHVDGDTFHGRQSGNFMHQHTCSDGVDPDRRPSAVISDK